MTVGGDVREWRERAGFSIRGLAARAGVASSTVWRIETGRLDPTVSMLERLRDATGGESGSGPSTREAAVSLALGRLTASELLRDPGPLLSRARARVELMSGRRDLTRSTQHWLTEWSRLLDGSLEGVVAALIDPSERGYELRQVIPFVGVLSQEDRLRVIRAATKEHRATRAA